MTFSFSIYFLLMNASLNEWNLQFPSQKNATPSSPTQFEFIVSSFVCQQGRVTFAMVGCIEQSLSTLCGKLWVVFGFSGFLLRGIWKGWDGISSSLITTL